MDQTEILLARREREKKKREFGWQLKSSDAFFLNTKCK